VNYAKVLLLAAPAVGIAAVTVVWLRPDDAPVAPSPWIVQAARALNVAAADVAPHAPVATMQGKASAARALSLEGQRLRVERRFAEAADRFRAAVEADPADADSWADLADCAAAAAGRDLSAGRDAIARALAIEPRHRKALWLRASLELQEGRYAAAAATWRELQPLVAAGTSDARVIAANIAEAEALAGSGVAPAGRGG
jgi:cytochrome c-type biogenesis protein CcmH